MFLKILKAILYILENIKSFSMGLPFYQLPPSRATPCKRGKTLKNHKALFLDINSFCLKNAFKNLKNGYSRATILSHCYFLK